MQTHTDHTQTCAKAGCCKNSLLLQERCMVLCFPTRDIIHYTLTSLLPFFLLGYSQTRAPPPGLDGLPALAPTDYHYVILHAFFITITHRWV
jgi:hypothetical protein